MEGHLNLKINLTFRAFCTAQFAVVTAVLVMGLLMYAYTHAAGHGKLLGFLTLLDVGEEQSIPTYVSVVNLLLASLLLLVIGLFEKTKNNSHYLYWIFLSAVLLLLSIDESVSLHEKFANVHSYLVAHELIAPILTTHEWLPFGLAFIVVLFLVLIPFIRDLPRKTFGLFLASAIVFVIGAVGFEYLGAVMLQVGAVESKNDFLYLLRRIFEEGFEMYGVVLFNCALYREILQRKFSLTFGLVT